MLPPVKPAEHLCEEAPDKEPVIEDLGEREVDETAEEIIEGYFQDKSSQSEVRTSADIAVPEDPMEEENPREKRSADAEALPSEASSALRPRLSAPQGEQRETSEVPAASSKVQRISPLVRAGDVEMSIFDLRISAVTAEQDLDVPVSVNQDEEMSLAERLSNPLFWRSPEFTKNSTLR